MAKKINYDSRNFFDYRSSLTTFIREYYPSLISDFNDAAVSTMFSDLMSAVGDNLSYLSDRNFQETQLDYAQERKSVMSLARTMGVKIPNKRPSITVVDFTVTVPANGDTYDVSYAPLIRRGAQVNGGGKVFETIDDIDFSSPFTTGGYPNLKVLPQRNDNGVIDSYQLVKREIVLNGITKIYKRTITPTDIKPFFNVILPEEDVLSIDSLIVLEGTNYTNNPSFNQFNNDKYRFYEVDSLIENKKFVESNNEISDNAGIKPGKFKKVNKRFIKEFTDLGFCKIIFGSGTIDTTDLCEYNLEDGFKTQMGDFINNMSLGELPQSNSTMFIKYRVGGGADANIGPSILTSVGVVNMTINGDEASVNTAVRNSLTVNNPVAAYGGREAPSIDEIRYLTKYNFASQNRCVTIPDYIARIQLMDGEFGVPFRSGVFEEKNAINIYVLGLNEEGKLSNASTSTMKENISRYLSDYRMVNDYIEISDGRVINLSFEVDLFIDKNYQQSEVISQGIEIIKQYMDINNFDMGDDVYMSQLIEQLNSVAGVLNVVDLRVFNKVGDNKYSVNEVQQPYLDSSTRQIDLTNDYKLYGEPTGLYEIRYPEKDIKIRVKS